MERLVFDLQYSVTFTHDVFNKHVLSEAWRNANGQLERPGDLPALTHFTIGTGLPYARRWFYKDLLHREGGPAVELLNPDTGQVVHETWHKFGECHRDGDLPAETFTDLNGNVMSEGYYQTGKLSRSNGPAIIRYNTETNRPYHSECWIDGRRIREAAFKSRTPEP